MSARPEAKEASAPSKEPSKSRDNRPAFHDRLDAMLDRQPAWVGFLLFLSLFLLYQSNGGTWNSGDTRALVDLSWWVWHRGEWSLTEHPGYMDKDPIPGYWAVRLDDGFIATVYPPGVLLFSVPGYAILDVFGVPSSLFNAPQLAKPIVAFMMAGMCVVGWFLLRKRVSALAALLAALLVGAASPIYGMLSQALWSQSGAVLAQALSCLFVAWMAGDGRGPSGAWRVIVLILAGFFAVWAAFCRPTFGAWSLFFAVFLAMRLRMEFWKPCIGAAVAIVLGLLLYNATTGSPLGLYTEKQTGEAGFTFNPVAMVSHFAGLMVSPGRGLLLYSPWTVLIAAGLVWMGLRQRWRDSWLLLHTGFLALMILTLSAFKLWHGGWSAGPRLQADALFSAFFVFAPVLDWMLKRWWGIALVAVLALPGVFIQHRIANMTGNTLERHVNVKMEETLWDWETGAYLWYATKGRTMREVLEVNREPHLEGNAILATVENPERFIQGGVRIVVRPDGVPVFDLVSREAVFTFVPPTGIASDRRFVIIEFDRSTEPGAARTLSVFLNRRKLGAFSFIDEVDPSQVALQIPSGAIEANKRNTLTIRDKEPAMGGFGDVLLNVRSIRFVGDSDVLDVRLSDILRD